MPSIRYVAPNRKTHPAFADALQAAKDAGVILSAVQCGVTLDEILPQKALEVVPNG
jgi:DNA-binding sugar fermentation-stimulating protein